MRRGEQTSRRARSPMSAQVKEMDVYISGGVLLLLILLFLILG